MYTVLYYGPGCFKLEVKYISRYFDTNTEDISSSCAHAVKSSLFYLGRKDDY